VPQPEPQNTQRVRIILIPGCDIAPREASRRPALGESRFLDRRNPAEKHIRKPAAAERGDQSRKRAYMWPQGSTFNHPGHAAVPALRASE
jgi:hypothetical protein